MPDRHAELVALLNKISEESVTASNVLADMLDLLRERLPEPEGVKEEPAPAFYDPDLAARNLDAIKHELETPVGEHGECCDPGEVTEPKVAAAASAPLRPGEYILNRDGSAYRVVGTSEPGGDDEAQEDPDGALADAEAERDELKVIAGGLSSKVTWWKNRAQRAEAERDEFKGFWKDALADVRKAREERDGWRAKHAALRADVDRLQREHKALPAMWDFVDALGHDAARTPQADPDTVTLRRDDSDLEVEINSKKGKPSSCIVRHQGMTVFHGVSLDAIVTDRPLRAALGWGDSDDA